MTNLSARFNELHTQLSVYHDAHAHLLDPDFDPAIDDLEREFAELLWIRE